MSHNGPLFQLGIDSTRRNGKAEIGSGGYFFPGRQVETVYTDSSRRTRRKLPSSETRGCAWNTKERFVARSAHRDQTSSGQILPGGGETRPEISVDRFFRCAPHSQEKKHTRTRKNANHDSGVPRSQA